MVDLEKIKKIIIKGDFEESIDKLNIILSLDNKNIDAMYLLAVSQEKLGDNKKAIKTYKKLIAKEKNYNFYDNLGKIYLKLNEFKTARKYFSDSLRINPDNANTQNTLGITLAMENMEGLAVKHFLNASEINQHFLDPIYNLLEIYEKTNNFNALRSLVKQKIKSFPSDQIILFYQSYIFEKDNKLNQALNTLRKIDFSKINLEWEVKAKFRIADIYHKSKKYSKAFEYFNYANKIILKNINADRFTNNFFLNEINKCIKYSTSSSSLNYSYKVKFPLDICFHIGFPRSGTTLIDAVLNSHSKIEVMEEIPIVDNMCQKLKLDDFDLINSEEKKQAKLFYQNSIEKQNINKNFHNKIIIDKLPLNLIRIKFLHNLFPNTKFIISVRHPLDCILSCFTQNFLLNSAMINFLDLKRTAIIYDKVMQIWQNSSKLTNLNMHIIKYEDLISNFDNETKKMITFLGLDWEENIKNYKKLLIKKERIRTPSYSQVIQPIYSSSINKWKNYEKELSPIRPIVQKWITYFNY